jgi:uncharacterized paraquat-inducible protein A
MNIIDPDCPGKAHLQPCERCALIEHSGPLEDGTVVCPKCGAWWITIDDTPSHSYVGCALMVWSAIVVVVIFGFWLASKLHGGVR